MDQFLLLLYEDPSGFSQLSPSEMQRIVGEYTAWADRLRESERLVGSQKLADEGGRTLSGTNGDLRVLDGPFAEAKEVIGGYFVIRADDYDAAVEIARGCPHLAYGGRIELRRVDPIPE